MAITIYEDGDSLYCENQYQPCGAYILMESELVWPVVKKKSSISADVKTMALIPYKVKYGTDNFVEIFV